MSNETFILKGPINTEGDVIRHDYKFIREDGYRYSALMTVSEAVATGFKCISYMTAREKGLV